MTHDSGRPSGPHLSAALMFILPIILFALPSGGSMTYQHQKEPVSLTLFSFASASEARWEVVNDGVMGGRSEGHVSVDDGILRFTGTLVTRGGGFTSVRADKVVDLDGFEGIELRVRGDGRTFEVQVDDGTRRMGRTVSRRAPFGTTGDWEVIRLPFRALRTTIFGQRVSAPPIDLSNVRSIGLFILDGIDGPFRLEVDEISAYRVHDEAALLR